MRTATARKWASVLADAEDSELTMREFARSRGVNPNTLAWWKWKLGREAHAAHGERFLEVVSGGPLVVVVGDVRIEVDHDTDVVLLRRVVGALA